RIDGDVRAARLEAVRVERDDDGGLIGDARPGDELALDGSIERLVLGDARLADVQIATAQRPPDAVIALPQPRDRGDAAVGRVIRVEEVAAGGFERAERPAEHAFADVAVGPGPGPAVGWLVLLIVQKLRAG